MLEALEGADGHAELLALADVRDGDRESTESTTHERGGGERAPLVDGFVVEAVRVRAGCEDDARACGVADGAVGERGRRQVRYERAGSRRDQDEVIGVERDHVMGHGAGRHEARDAVARGRSASVAIAVPSTTPLVSAPVRARSRALTACSTSGAGASRRPSASMASARSRIPAPPPPSGSGRPMPGAPMATS